MNGEALDSLLSVREPSEEDVRPGTEKSSEVQNPSDAALSDSSSHSPAATGVQSNATGVEPPVDWLEPVEDDDDANSVGKHDAEEESLAGESERSESVAGSEKAFKRIYKYHAPRRKRSHTDDGWEECGALGEGWKRKEVIRRSGSSVGQKDIYYLSPRGDRVRSKVELVSVLEGFLDLTYFDYKSGRFYNGEAPPIRIRNRVKKKVRERSSSESSFMERGEGADTPDSNHRLTPSGVFKNAQSNPTRFSPPSRVGTPSQVLHQEDLAEEEINQLPVTSSRPHLLPSINGEIGTEESLLVCARCGTPFTGTWYDKQRKRPCCLPCWASKTKEHPVIRFRKWIPCGQCVGCSNTVNCGQCANCKHEMQSPESRKRLCRKRKCICPIRKGPGSIGVLMKRSTYNDNSDAFDDTRMSSQSEVTDSQPLKSSDTENLSLNVDLDDDDDMSTDDDDDWHKKRKRRSCGECKACLYRKDCGTCDFCIDKPKFGGSNKKRQKCRLRQCQRQAMRHLLPYQMGQGGYGSDGSVLPGRPRPHYAYSRKSSLKRKAPRFSLDLTDNEDDDSNLQDMNWTEETGTGGKHSYETNERNHQSSLQDQQYKWEAERSHADTDVQSHLEEDEDADEDEDDEELPMITQIFSLADHSAGSSVDVEGQLMKLLQSLRTSVLPILWYAIMVDGPQLQLIQCSKKSSMTDTMVLIDPGFCYQVTVQKQPLLPTHPLYDSFPPRLTSVKEIVNLLLGLEKYVVCQGLSPTEPCSSKNPIILERASTCDFLVNRNVSICSNCQALQGL